MGKGEGKGGLTGKLDIPAKVTLSLDTRKIVRPSCESRREKSREVCRVNQDEFDARLESDDPLLVIQRLTIIE